MSCYLLEPHGYFYPSRCSGNACDYGRTPERMDTSTWRKSSNHAWVCNIAGSRYNRLPRIIAAAGIADVFGVGGVSFQRLHGSHHNGYDFLISLLTTMQNFLPRSILKVHKGFVALVDIKIIK